MSFVIKSKIEANDLNLEKNQFDVVPYNYIYNKRSSFLDSEFVFDDHATLKYVLENCYKINPKLLDALAYGSPYTRNTKELDLIDHKYEEFISKNMGLKKQR